MMQKGRISGPRQVRQGLVHASILVVLMLGNWTCAVEELDVAYLYVPAFRVVIDGEEEAAAITDVRVVLGSESLGFYPLPARIPIVGTGLRRIRLEPVVQRSGRSEERVAYDPYAAFEEERTLVPGRTDTIRPTVGFAIGTKVAFEEDFESAGITFIQDLVEKGSPILRAISGSEVRKGNGSGRIDFSSAENVYEVASILVAPIPTGTGRVWLELDYKGDVPLIVGLLEPTPQVLPQGVPRAGRYSVGARARPEWQKFYFDILDPRNREFVQQGFRVVLLAEIAADSAANRSIFVDNIRLVYR